MLNKRCITVLRYIKSYSKLRTQNPSKSLKITLLSEKGDNIPKLRLPACRRLLFPLLHAEKGRLRNAVANRVPASRWQGI